MTAADSSRDMPQSQPRPAGTDDAALESTFLKTVFAELTGQRKPPRRKPAGLDR
ncbi:MAG: hypothetical protein ACFB13_15785 [Kiloniellaceae bacterium]